MAWQVIGERRGGWLLWEGRDAEGRRIYSAQHAKAERREPAGGQYSIRAAIAEARAGRIPTAYLASIGAKGGKAKGAAKVRGGSDHYSEMGKRSALARREHLAHCAQCGLWLKVAWETPTERVCAQCAASRA
jgi:hypothetical protein